MANIRLVLLFTVALVALAPVMVRGFLPKISEHLLSKLAGQKQPIQAPLMGVEDCQPDALEISNSHSNSGDETQEENMPSSDETRRDQLLSFCAQNIRPVFEMSTAGITDEAKKSIMSSATGSAYFNVYQSIVSSELTDSCQQVTKSVANVRYIKRQAKTSSSVSLDELLGDEWKELDNACFIYSECYLTHERGEPWTGLRADICNLGANDGKFSGYFHALRRQMKPEYTE